MAKLNLFNIFYYQDVFLTLFPSTTCFGSSYEPSSG